MKILFVVDHFGPGGAQRQIVNLACGLRRRGHQVECFIYHPAQRFFRPLVEQAGIVVHEVNKGRGFSFAVLWRLICLLRRGKFDGVIAFLASPAVYAELAKPVTPGTILVVSERSSHLGDKSHFAALARRLLHGLADYVVANSRSQGEWLSRYWWLRRKVSTIYNGYALDECPPARPDDLFPDVSLLVVGRIGPEKNALRLVEALVRFQQKHGYSPRVTWVGRRDMEQAGMAYCSLLDAMLERHPEIQSRWKWLGERTDVPQLLARHHALAHPSLYEGLPNVVCEALVAGRPVLASNVCDHPMLVDDGKSGFLFDPEDTQSISSAIERLAGLSTEEWMSFSANARRYAEENLGLERMLTAYEALLKRAPSRNKA